jgi:hypothetical protein
VCARERALCVHKYNNTLRTGRRARAAPAAAAAAAAGVGAIGSGWRSLCGRQDGHEHVAAAPQRGLTAVGLDGLVVVVVVVVV